MGVLDKILRAGEGKVLRKLEGIVRAVNAIEEDFVHLTDEELRALTDEYRERLAAADPAAWTVAQAAAAGPGR